VNIQYDGGVVPLGLKIPKEHTMAWNIEARVLEAPVVTTWWVPYDLKAIMRYGHTVNTEIPEDVNEAEFPQEPWPERVVIRIKSQTVPQIPAAPLPAAGDPQSPLAPGAPSGWKGAALGQAQPISTDASGLVGYHSQYDGANVPKGIEEKIPTNPELLRLRGEVKRDEEVHMLVSWTTRKSYPTLAGISLPIQDPVGGEFHEGKLWEEVTEDLMIAEKHAQAMYEWLKLRLRERSSQNMLPEGMPETINEITVQTSKDGRAGCISFTPTDSLEVPMKKMDVQAIIEYDLGYMKVGMGEAYTITMLAHEFHASTQNQWNFYPIMGYRRMLDGSVIHKVTVDFDEFQTVRAQEAMVVPPVKVLEERGRGTEIYNTTDQGKLLQCWAWLQQPIEVGVLFPDMMILKVKEAKLH
jgi:hypothetical protein